MPQRSRAVFLSLGSNSGNRLLNLRRALRAVRRLPKTRLVRASSIYETSPVGRRDQKDYLNACAEIRTALSPMGLLIELKRLEAACGRKPGAPRWSARALDIDILFYDGIRLRGRFLTLPHPRALRRRFVLMPLVELRPGWKPAGRRETLRRSLARLNAPAQNVTVYTAR